MAINNQQRSSTFVCRAGTKQGPSFDLKDKSIDKVWLATSPKLFFPLGQDLPVPNKEGFEEVLLWRTNVSNLSNNFMCDSKHDGVIQVEFNDSRNLKNPVKEVQTCLKSLKWEKTTVPRCGGGFSQMNLSPLVQAMIVYMKDNYPNTPKELNFHAELKAACHWCLSDDYKQVVVKKVPVGDCRLKIAAKETLKTWEKKEKDLCRGETDKMKLLSDFREAIGVLKNYLKEGKRVPNGVVKNHLGGDKKAGTKLLQNGSPRKRKQEANGDGTVRAKRVKPALRRVSPRRQQTFPVKV
ncbi:PREDICTED: uncharacterized protein LOC107332228 isoform X2 [Acropora digitifera]|uniref:uncharacterized protein LOC107332228 isoform X2 n=1 Tax=Acropora digitifera TaxID=70779 RepID=UPI00077B2115|nr:PREDICTED: uncharacterized protein LOC107332228 isoform X2 [Acropora digitifera]